MVEAFERRCEDVWGVEEDPDDEEGEWEEGFGRRGL